MPVSSLKKETGYYVPDADRQGLLFGNNRAVPEQSPSIPAFI
jgi:hypothetical protein